MGVTLGFGGKAQLSKHIMNVHLKLRPYKCRFGCEFGKLIIYIYAIIRAIEERKCLELINSYIKFKQMHLTIYMRETY